MICGMACVDYVNRPETAYGKHAVFIKQLVLGRHEDGWNMRWNKEKIKEQVCF